jgi:site-specific recombinase XerD
MYLETAVLFFIADIEARRLSKNTILDYTRQLNKLKKHFGGDKDITKITVQDLRLFLASFPELKAKSLNNVHNAVSSFYTFLVNEGIVKENILKNISAPRPDVIEVDPFTANEIKLLFVALKKTNSYQYKEGSEIISREARNQRRNKAILMLLLDAGPRASELISLKIEDLDLKARIINIKVGKGRKMRSPPFSAATTKALMGYLEERKQIMKKLELPPNPANGDYLFISSTGKPMTRKGLWQTVANIGERAGVNAYPHRFRHTFAIFYLKNGGNVYFLQQILGHADLKMVKRYLSISKQDLAEAHKHFSPVANLGL